MAELITSQSEIPTSPFYVCATDRFMSGWGMSTNRDNVVIFPAANHDEAQHIGRKLNARAEMKYVRINTTKPRLNNSTHTYSLFDPDDASAFYKKES